MNAIRIKRWRLLPMASTQDEGETTVTVWMNLYDEAGDAWWPWECPVIQITENTLMVITAGRRRILDRLEIERDGKTASGNDVYYATRDLAESFCRRWKCAIV